VRRRRARARSDDREPRWELGPRFEGLRGVGAGLHLLSFAPRGDGAGREGVFVACAAGDVLLKAWDAANERAGGVSFEFLFVNNTNHRCVAHGGGAPPLDAPQLRSLRAAAARLRLAPYPDGHAATWAGLSGFVTAATLKRAGLAVDVVFGPGSVDDEAGAGDGASASLTRCDAVRLRELFARSVDTPTAFFGPDASARVEALAAADFGGDVSAVLGEWQLAFVLFLAVGSFGALRQWQRLASLLCACDALLDRADVCGGGFFEAVKDVLQNQLALAPPDFFEDALSRDEDVLRPALGALLEAAAARPALAPGAEALFAFGKRRFGLWRPHATLAAALAAGALEPEPATVLDDRRGADAAADPGAAGFPALAAHRRPDEDAAMAAARLLDRGAADAALLADPTLPAARRDATAFLEGLAAKLDIAGES